MIGIEYTDFDCDPPLEEWEDELSDRELLELEQERRDTLEDLNED